MVAIALRLFGRAVEDVDERLSAVVERAEQTGNIQTLAMVLYALSAEQHGVRAFDDRAVDYLLKPVSLQRLRETVSRLESRLPSGAVGGPAAAVRKLPLPVGRRIAMVDETDIQVIRAQGNYLDIGVLLADQLGGGRPVNPRHDQVHQHHIRLALAGQPDRLFAIGGFTDQFHIIINH